jgi:hypothetical protein
MTRKLENNQVSVKFNSGEDFQEEIKSEDESVEIDRKYHRRVRHDQSLKMKSICAEEGYS